MKMQLSTKPSKAIAKSLTRPFVFQREEKTLKHSQTTVLIQAMPIALHET